MTGATEKALIAERNGLGRTTDAALVSIGVVFCYASLFSTLLTAWWTNPVYSHGFLIPFISGYLVWKRAGALKGVEVSGGLWGAPLLAIGLAAFVLGRAAGVLALEELSFMLTVIGAVAFVFGGPFLKAVLFPLLYLAFMLTSWGEFTERLHYPFQNFSANLGAKLLQLMNIPAYRESIYIELPSVTLEVAKVCSGVNYLVSVAAIGIPLSYVALSSWKRRIILVAGALVMSVLANSVRVTLIGFLSYYNLSGDLHGPLHVLHAMVVSFAGYIVLFAGVWILSKGEGRRKAEDVAPGDVHPRGARNGPLAVSLALLAAIGLYAGFHRDNPVPLKGDIRGLPLAVNEFAGADATGAMKNASIADQSLSRIYRGDAGEITLDVSYFESQSQGKELVNFRSSALHRGSTELRLKFASGGEAVVNKKTVETNGRRTTTLFWYMSGGKVMSGKYETLLHIALSSVLGRGTSGAFVAISAEDGGGTAGAALEGFAGAVIPELERLIP